MTSQTTGHEPRVSVVGLGQMGAGIARNLHSAGLLAGVSDIDGDAFSRCGLPDAVPCLPVDELIEASDVLLFATPSTRQVEEALGTCRLVEGFIVIDVTTSSPTDSRRVSESLEASGAHYLDAAMTGGAAGADAGTLTLMIGGDSTIFESCRPVFDAIAARTFLLGPVGSGHAMKLIHNMILHSAFLATCEGLKLAERAGLDVSEAVDVLNAGNARSFVTETRFPRDILSGTMNGRSTISNLEKDLGLAVAFGDALEAGIPYGKLTHALLARAVEDGQSQTDFSWLFPFYEGMVSELDRTT